MLKKVFASNILWFVVVWVLLGFLFGFKTYRDYSFVNERAEFSACVGLAMIQWLAWLGVYVLVLAIPHRGRTEKTRWVWFFLGHTVVGLAVALAMYVFAWVTYCKFIQLGWLPFRLLNQITLLTNCLVYVALVGFAFSCNMFQRASMLAVENSRFNETLAIAKLNSLKMSLKPHFLFNSLNTIAMLIEADREKASQATGLLGDYLRSTLEVSNENLIALSVEIDLIQRYLRIEQVRFGDRIQLELDICEQSANAMVPNMILQPIVENSLRHGFRASTEIGIVRIRSYIKDGILVITVEDTGAAPLQNIYQFGHGLSNTRDRLKLAFGRDGNFEIHASENGGSLAMLQMPFCKSDSLLPN